MKRRMFSSLVAATALLPVPGNAQGPARRLRLGILRPTATFSNEPLVRAFRELGYAEGQTLILNEQDAGPDPSALREIALDMAQRKPDVMLAIGAAATDAAQATTRCTGCSRRCGRGRARWPPAAARSARRCCTRCLR